MLIETKAITELGLVFGNTWAVVAIVIGGILLGAFLANQWVIWRGPVNSTLAFGLLGGALLIGLGVTRLQMAGVVIPAAASLLEPQLREHERIGGSRAQHDLIEFTLLRACLDADRLDEARQLLGARRPGASGIPVLGVDAVR